MTKTGNLIVTLAIIFVLGAVVLTCIGVTHHGSILKQELFQVCIQRYPPAECRAGIWGLDYTQTTVDR